ncbi:MAG: NAD-dependent epimerase/dehydratase family protein [Caulobacteraceae bacterium]|nr:NAD-dependent epimerase/dehydratase family protein [Caulobacteraceae bacterium]
MKTALVLGAGGFIGSHMVKRLKSEGYWVRGVDLKFPEFSQTAADHFIVSDLRIPHIIKEFIRFAGVAKDIWDNYSLEFDKPFDEIYQFAADMGGAGYIFTGEHDADIMHNSAIINLNLLNAVKNYSPQTKIFYSSSACMYPAYNQEDPENPICSENSAYPAAPDSEYGWEKLFSERLYLTYNKNYGIPVRVARYHNIFGPEGTWQGGKEKAPAAICRKVALSKDGVIEVWGDGEQTRSFLYIDECIEATRRLMKSDFIGPVNIGSEEMVTINHLVSLAAKVANKDIAIKHINGPTGVRGRNSDNNLIREKLGWDYSQSLEVGIKKIYDWIVFQIKDNQKNS